MSEHPGDRLERELLAALDASEVLDEGLDGLDGLERRHEVNGLLDALLIGSTIIRAQMLADPDRSAAVLRHASTAPGIRNRAAFAIAGWRSGFDPRRAPSYGPRPEYVEGPPTLADIEYAWSLEPDAPVTMPYVLRMMAAAITRAGGFTTLKGEA